MDFTSTQLAKIFARLRTLETIAEYFHLSEEQLEHPECARYIEEILKNMEQPGKIIRHMNLLKDFPETPAFNPPFPGTLEGSGTPEK